MAENDWTCQEMFRNGGDNDVDNDDDNYDYNYDDGLGLRLFWLSLFCKFKLTSNCCMKWFV